MENVSCKPSSRDTRTYGSSAMETRNRKRKSSGLVNSRNESGGVKEITVVVAWTYLVTTTESRGHYHDIKEETDSLQEMKRTVMVSTIMKASERVPHWCSRIERWMRFHWTINISTTTNFLCNPGLAFNSFIIVLLESENRSLLVFILTFVPSNPVVVIDSVG